MIILNTAMVDPDEYKLTVNFIKKNHDSSIGVISNKHINEKTPFKTNIDSFSFYPFSGQVFRINQKIKEKVKKP